jgi:ribosomal protein S18 acetylase RimI-like enzyme
MSGLEIQPFTEEHLDGAAARLEERHRRHREAEPLLGERYDYRAEIEALDNASGVAGTRAGRVVGYLLGVRNDDARWGPNVWVEAAGHAVDEPEEIRDLYAAAAARWFEEGRTRHYVMAPASDPELLGAWARLSFGHQHAHGIREVTETPWPEEVRPASDGDLDAMFELSPLLVEHQAQAPVFGIGIPRESEEETRAMIVEDLANPKIGDLLAEQNGRVVGAFQLAPIELSGMHLSLARPDGAVLLSWAATRPDMRGSGVGVALMDASLAWAHENGYRTIVTDWRETNLLASRFWPRRGFRRTFIRLYRSIP